MKRYLMTSNDMLVLRDGRPFGETGVFGGTSLYWPLPQTIAGMCRTAIGVQRDPDLFQDEAKTQEMLNIGIGQILPHLLSDKKPSFLLPTPADMVFTGEKEQQVHLLKFAKLSENEGSDIQSPDWLYPLLALKEKPAPRPKFLCQELATRYLQADPSVDDLHISLNDVVTGPITDTRIHTAIDWRTNSVREGQLFAESSIYLVADALAEHSGLNQSYGQLTMNIESKTLHRELSLGFNLNGLWENEEPPSTMYCGGERRRVSVLLTEDTLYPDPPVDLENQQFVKLVLTTHGDFGGWAPQWLVPDADKNLCPWVQEPRSGVTLRLRSAVLAGWVGASGWDYAKKQPKAFRKLVRPGSLYLIELKNPNESSLLTKKIWGQSLCTKGSQSERDGYGQAVVAKNLAIQE